MFNNSNQCAKDHQLYFDLHLYILKFLLGGREEYYLDFHNDLKATKHEIHDFEELHMLNL